MLRTLRPLASLPLLFLLPQPSKCDAPAPVYKASIKALRGHRPYMEDEWVLGHGGRLAGVFDGHGGSKVSGFCRESLVPAFDRIVEGENKEGETKPSVEGVERGLEGALREVSKRVLAKGTWKYQGSTAVVCYIHTQVDKEGNNVSTIVSGNIGDSRAVLSRGKKAVDLTRDHKPNDEEETRRIKALGGKVVWHGYVDAKGKPIPGTGVYRINGNLAVARAIGDASERPYVSDVAEMRRLTVDSGLDDFIILASDGLWDVMSSQDAVSFVHGIQNSSVGGMVVGSDSLKASRKLTEWASEHGSDVDMIRAAHAKRKKRMAKFLADEAMRKGSGDNICVIVLWLKE